MNKVFKTVWNASLGVWVAVSETASSQKKGSNKLKKAAANAVATVVIGAAAVASAGAMAYTNGHGTAVSGGIAIGAENGSANAQEESVAIGKSAAAAEQGAIAVGAMAEAKEQGTIAIGYTSKAQAIGAVAFGSNANAQGANSIALGTSATAQVSGTAVGKSSTAANKATAVGFSAKANSDESTAIGYNAKATGTNSVAINGTANGTNTFALGGTASGENAFALGGTAEGTNAFALGGLATADDTVAIGTGSTVSAKNSAAIGLLNDISGENTFVLGSNVSTSQINSVILGNQSVLSTVYNKATVEKADYAYQDVNGQTQTSSQVFNFAGMHTTNTVGAVSVGKKGAERQIQYVGAGRITSESTDAVNGSQLYYVLSEAKQAQADAAKPITFDDGKGGQATVKLGDTFNIEGATVKMVDGKPVLTVNAAEAAAWKLATGGNVANASTIGGETNVVDFVGSKNAKVSQTELKDGDTVIGTQVNVEVADQINLTGNGGLTIAASGDKDPINLQQGNVSFGKNQLNDVAVGQDDTDAVNVSQLKGAVNTLGGGAKVNPDGSINAPLYTVGAENKAVNTVGDAINVLNQGFTLTSSNASGAAAEQIQAGDAIDITVTEENDNLVAKQNGSTIEFALADQINLTGDAGSLTIGAGAGKQPIVIQQGNVNLGGNKLENIAAGTALTDAVNVSQLQSSGWNIITQDKDADGKVTGTTENAVNGDKEANTSSVQFNGDKNISVSQSKDEQTGQPVITVELEKDIDLSEEGSLTIGNTLLNNDGLMIGQSGGNKTIIINQGNVNFGGNVLAGVAPGVAGTDAVNVDQLTGTTDSVVNIIGGGVTNGPNNTVTGPFEVNGTQYPDIAEAIKNETAAAKTEVTAGKNITVTPTVDPQTGKTTYEVKTNDEVDFEKVTVGDVVISAESDDITGLSNTKIGDDAEPDFATVGRAATEEQLDKAITGLGDILGGGLINNNGQITGPFVVNGTGYDTVADAIKNEAEVAAEAAKIKVTEGKNITVTASTDPDTGKITGYEVKTNDEVDFEKVTVGDVVISAESNDITGLSNTTIGNQAAPDFAQAGRGATEEQLDGTAGSVANILGGNVTNNNGSVTGPFVVNENEYNTVADAIEGESAAAKTEVQAGKNITVNTTVGANGQNIYTVATADKASFTEVKFGDKVTINENGINAGDTQIINVAAGTENHHAVNLGQMNTAITNLEQSFNTRIDDVEDRMSAGIASAMALETAPYVPGKYTYAAAVAHHNGQSALGVTLRKTADNGRWSLTGGVAAGTEGDPSVRLGVSGIID